MQRLSVETLMNFYKCMSAFHLSRSCLIRDNRREAVHQGNCGMSSSAAYSRGTDYG